MAGMMRTEEFSVYASQIKGPVTKLKLLNRFIEITQPPDNCFIEQMTTTVMPDGRIECVFNVFDL